MNTLNTKNNDSMLKAIPYKQSFFQDEKLLHVVLGDNPLKPQSQKMSTELLKMLMNTAQC